MYVFGVSPQWEKFSNTLLARNQIRAHALRSEVLGLLSLCGHRWPWAEAIAKAQQELDDVKNEGFEGPEDV